MGDMKWIEHDGYKMIQSELTHNITVCKDEREVMHLNVSKQMSDEEIIATVSDTLCLIAGKLPGIRSERDCFDVIYDGDEPC